jgi:hypothetical protein
MRRALLTLLAGLALVGGPQTARADVLNFNGLARIELHEILVHGDWYNVDTTVVDIEIDLRGPRATSSSASGIGTAKILRADGTATTIRLFGNMEPPAGGGGFVGATGVGDGALYCFRIWDQSGAPSPGRDRLVAAFEPLSRFAQGYGEDYVEALTGPGKGSCSRRQIIAFPWNVGRR